MKVYLIGFMGAGKTTLGKKVAAQLGFEFIDLDDLVEERESRTVQEIFEKEGEALFRIIEQESLKFTAQLKGNYLIACGGGTPCFYNNMDLMNEMGKTIYLKASAKELARRLQPIKAHRPLISRVPDEKLTAHIQQLLQGREPYYQQAQHILKSDNPSHQQLADLIE